VAAGVSEPHAGVVAAAVVVDPVVVVGERVEGTLLLVFVAVGSFAVLERLPPEVAVEVALLAAEERRLVVVPVGVVAPVAAAGAIRHTWIHPLLEWRQTAPIVKTFRPRLTVDGPVAGEEEAFDAGEGVEEPVHAVAVAVALVVA